MKNLLKLAVLALALSCFQAYGHPSWYTHFHESELGCRFPCNVDDAVCQVKDLYEVKEIITVLSYRTYFLVRFVSMNGERYEIEIKLDCWRL